MCLLPIKTKRLWLLLSLPVVVHLARKPEAEGSMVHRVLEKTVSYGHGLCLPSFSCLRRWLTSSADAAGVLPVVLHGDREDI